MKSSLDDIEAIEGVHRHANDEPVFCNRCGDGRLAPERVKIAFWRDDALVVIRGVPAMVCGTCGEEYVSDEAALGLDRMRGEGFESHGVADRMIVPVVDFVDPGCGRG